MFFISLISGLSTDKVEYGNFDYFAMIFTTGICNGLFYDGASAPIVGYNNSTDNLLIYKGKYVKIVFSRIYDFPDVFLYYTQKPVIVFVCHRYWI